MQANFAFVPSAAMEILPKGRLADFPTTRVPARDKCLPGDNRAADSDRSFNASLREARRKHEEAARPRPVDDRPRAVKEQHEHLRSKEPERCKSKSTSGSEKYEERDNPDRVDEKSVAEQQDQIQAPPVDGEENPVDELAGAEGVTAPVPSAGIPDSSLGPIPNSDATPAVSTVVPPEVVDIPVDNPVLVSASETSEPKTQPTLLNESSIKTGLETAAGVSDTEENVDAKSENTVSSKTAEGVKTAAADTAKSFDDLMRAESKADHADKVNTEARTDSNAVMSPKADAGGRLSEQIQSLQNPQEEQAVPHQKIQDVKIPQTEDAAPARISDVSADQQNAGRVQGEIQQTREGEAKSQPAGGDEALPKLAKMDSGSKDGTFMHHQEQNFDRLTEPSTPTREKEAALGAWRAQTLDQIVSKAVYQLKNGLNEVRIDLKPEFLGQVRMHIVTVEQQVSVRIVAELPIVREMLQNNLQQLKADLQQQGLEVDEIEVSVSTNSQHQAQSGRMKSESFSQWRTDAEKDGDAASQPAPETVARARSANSVVDMFA